MFNKKEKTKILKLIVTFKNGTIKNWTVEKIKNKSKFWHYYQFCNWYLNKPQSNKFIFKSIQSDTLILRDQIVCYEIIETIED